MKKTCKFQPWKSKSAVYLQYLLVKCWNDEAYSLKKTQGKTIPFHMESSTKYIASLNNTTSTSPAIWNLLGEIPIEALDLSNHHCAWWLHAPGDEIMEFVRMLPNLRNNGTKNTWPWPVCWISVLMGKSSRLAYQNCSRLLRKKALFQDENPETLIMLWICAVNP